MISSIVFAGIFIIIIRLVVKVAAAAAARSRTAAMFTHSATEEGKAMFGYSLGYRAQVDAEAYR